ncbi:MAG: hypothetical protein LBI96_03580 [Odoribacteraceae bacterium]|jgi:hypothetical protein|nr:hypothetical protein [Odoribacteraceae bacterium]
MRVDYIPRKDAGFQQWSKNFVIALEMIQEEIRFPKESFNDLKALSDIYNEAYEVAINTSTRTKTAVLAKDQARAALEKEIRRDVKEFIANNRLVNPVYRNDLGLRAQKSTREAPPVAEHVPGYHVYFPEIFTVAINFFDVQGGRRGRKAIGQHGVEIKWGVNAAGVVNANDLPNSSFDTRSPFIINFPQHEQGKIFSFALRWENSRGEKGPWTTVFRVGIP